MNSNNHEQEICPDHNKIVKFIPPTEIDKERNKLIVTFYCPDGGGHNFTKEYDLKTKY